MQTPAKTIFLQVGNRRYQVASFEQASQMFCAARDKSGEGASNTPDLEIVHEDGTVIGRISYNGRVWPTTEWTPGSTPLYDNRAAQ